MIRGYFGIGIYQVKSDVNIGTLWRSAYNLGASFIFTTGRRYKHQVSDTVKAYRSLPMHEFIDFEDFKKHRPMGAILIGIEQRESSLDLTTFSHPERAIYLLGAEDHGLTSKVMNYCDIIVNIPSLSCLNVAVAGSIVMYDRSVKESTSLDKKINRSN